MCLVPAFASILGFTLSVALSITDEEFNTATSQLDAYIRNTTLCEGGEIVGYSFGATVFDTDAGKWRTFTRGYGRRNVDRNETINADTISGIGSTTKGFTSLIIAQLVHEGKIPGLDTPVREYIVEWPGLASAGSENLTLVDLMSHRTGIARNDLSWLMNSTIPREELIMKRLHRFTAKNTYREAWNYSNLCNLAAAWIAEKVTGKPWIALVKEYVFVPLGMSRTHAHFKTARTDANYADPHTFIHASRSFTSLNRDINEVLDFVDAVGSIQSTANDMMKYLQFQLSGEDGKIHHSSVEKSHTMHMMLAASNDNIFFPEADTEFVSLLYGLGWFQGSYRGTKFLFHSGGTLGHTTHIYMFPDMKLALYGNFNSGGDPMTLSGHKSIYARAVDLFTDRKAIQLPIDPCLGKQNETARTLGSVELLGPPRSYYPEFSEDLDSRSNPTLRTMDHETARSLEGEYYNPAYGVFQIKMTEESRNADTPKLKSSFADQSLSHGTFTAVTQTKKLITNFGLPDFSDRPAIAISIDGDIGKYLNAHMGPVHVVGVLNTSGQWDEDRNSANYAVHFNSAQNGPKVKLADRHIHGLHLILEVATPGDYYFKRIASLDDLVVQTKKNIIDAVAILVVLLSGSSFYFFYLRKNKNEDGSEKHTAWGEDNEYSPLLL